jgi:hypothetical protein
MVIIKIVFAVLAAALLLGILLGKGEDIPGMFSRFRAPSEKSAILVASRPELLSLSSNVTEFTVGERLYFHLHVAGDPPETWF